MRAASFPTLRAPSVSVDVADSSRIDIDDARWFGPARQRNDEEERLAIRASTEATRIVTRLRRPADFARLLIDERRFGRRCDDVLGRLFSEVKRGQFHLLHEQIIAPRVRLGRFIATTTTRHGKQQG